MGWGWISTAAKAAGSFFQPTVKVDAPMDVPVHVPVNANATGQVMLTDNPDVSHDAFAGAAQAAQLPETAEHVGEGATRAAVDGHNATTMTNATANAVNQGAAQIPAAANAGRNAGNLVAKAGSFWLVANGLGRFLGGVANSSVGWGNSKRAAEEARAAMIRAENQRIADERAAAARQTQANAQAEQAEAQRIVAEAHAETARQDQHTRDTLRATELAHQERLRAPTELTAEETAAEAMSRKGMNVLKRKVLALLAGPDNELWLYAIVLGSSSLMEAVETKLAALVRELQGTHPGCVHSIFTKAGQSPVFDDYDLLIKRHYAYHNECKNASQRRERMFKIGHPVIVILSSGISPLRPVEMPCINLLPEAPICASLRTLAFAAGFEGEGDLWEVSGKVSGYSTRRPVPPYAQQAPIHIVGIEESCQPQISFKGACWIKGAASPVLGRHDFVGWVYRDPGTDEASLRSFNPEPGAAFVNIDECFQGIAFEQGEGTFTSKPHGGYPINYDPLPGLARPDQKPNAGKLRPTGGTPPPSYAKAANA